MLLLSFSVHFTLFLSVSCTSLISLSFSYSEARVWVQACITKWLFVFGTPLRGQTERQALGREEGESTNEIAALIKTSAEKLAGLIKDCWLNEQRTVVCREF